MTREKINFSEEILANVLRLYKNWSVALGEWNRIDNITTPNDEGSKV
jgi:hypothetical protein